MGEDMSDMSREDGREADAQLPEVTPATRELGNPTDGDVPDSNTPGDKHAFAPSAAPDPTNPPGRKLPGWRNRLTDFLRDNHARPFVPGRWDCAIWAAGAVEAMTGEDLMRGFRGYRTIPEGKRKLQAKGFEDHVAYVASLLPEVPPAFAQPGDVAVLAEQSLGIVQGANVYVFGVNGFGTLPFTVIDRAFRT